MIKKVVINKKGVQQTIKLNANEVFDLKNLRGERWKQISCYEGLYEISSYGRVKSLWTKKDNEEEYSEQILRLLKNNEGYFIIDLFKKNNSRVGKRFLVHRLVAQAFIPNPENKKQVRHKNKIRTNNNVSNLEWSSGAMKGRFGKDNHRSKKILQYDLSGYLIKEWDSIKQIHEELGFSVINIRLVCNGKQKKSNNFVWRYKNKIKIKKIKI